MNERILVVDDTPANLQALSAVLKEQGYPISVATNGKQALEVLERVRPDLILLDVMMPEMDGFETCRRLKQSPAWREIPVVFLTSKSETDDVVAGFEAGAVDYVAKPFNAHELLARVRTHLTIDRLRRDVAEKSEQLVRARKREMDLAFRVQARLMPARLPELAGWSLAADWQPALEVSGDYYDFIADRGRLGVVVADVSGKGMPAALFMASTRSVLRAKATAALGPAEILTQANALLCADAVDGMFVTLFYAEIDAASGSLAYASAGHNPPFWYRAASGDVVELAPTGSVLAMDEERRWGQERIEPASGDVLLFYTDGYPEAFDARRRAFGDERLKEVLKRTAKETPERIRDEMRRAVDEFVGGAPRSDDLTLVVAKRL